MVKALIRMGDMTTHGGKVIEGFSDYTIQGIPVAGVGHKTICPLCKGVFPIIQGYGGITVNGVWIALDGYVTACGAKLIATQMEEVVDDGGGGDIMGGATQQSKQTQYASLSDNQRSMINDGVYRPGQDKVGIALAAAEDDDNLNPSRFRGENGQETNLPEWSNQQNYNRLLNEAQELAKKDGFRYDGFWRDHNKPYTQDDVNAVQRDVDQLKRGEYWRQRLQKAEQLRKDNQNRPLLQFENFDNNFNNIPLPERSLPRDENGNNLPDRDYPHTQYGRKNSKRSGVYPQAREWDYDENGNLVPKRDIDFTDHNRSDVHPNPHAHEYENNSTGGSLRRSKKAKPIEIPKDKPWHNEITTGPKK